MVAGNLGMVRCELTGVHMTLNQKCDELSVYTRNVYNCRSGMASSSPVLDVLDEKLEELAQKYDAASDVFAEDINKLNVIL